ncbi:hypothetical protein D2M30_0203 [Bacillus amyloliquefaciens]|nr:hypothetical protein D2M30_0203 [Bacillus amyloliquefaciens]
MGKGIVNKEYHIKFLINLQDRINKKEKRLSFEPFSPFFIKVPDQTREWFLSR